MRQLELSQEKIQLIKEARVQEQKEAQKKIEEEKSKQQKLLSRINELEKQILEDRNYFNSKLQSFNSIGAHTPDSLPKFPS